MLNRVKGALTRPIKPVAEAIARSGVDPNILTLSGLALALIAPLAAHLYGPLGALIAIALSSVLDALDGEVARASGRASRAGAFLDSLCDRISDLAYIASIMVLGVSPLLAYIAGGSSIIISYIRARAESLGIGVSGVGLMERGERVLGLAIIALLGVFDRAYMELAMIVFTALTLYTAAERAAYTLKALSRGHPR